MTELYMHIVLMSIAASCVFILLKLTGRLTQRLFSASWHYYSYLILFALFVIPIYRWFQADNPTAAAMPAFPVEQPVSGLAMDAAVYVLFTGTLIFAAVHLFRYHSMHRTLRHMCKPSANEQHMQALTWGKQQLNIKRPVSIYISPSMTTPFIYGLWRPKIVLPSMLFTEDELRHIFLHELTHYKRGDLWINLLLTVIQSLHWFNPVAYMARRDINRYGEYACDETLARNMDSSERKQYCELLLKIVWNVIDQKNAHCATMSQGRKSLEKRMTTVLKERNKKRKTNIMAGVTATMTLAVFGTLAGQQVDANTSLSNGTDSTNSNIHEWYGNNGSVEHKHDLDGIDSEQLTDEEKNELKENSEVHTEPLIEESSEDVNETFNLDGDTSDEYDAYEE